jgi:DNA invertase Pin-like site-specific DNA recombinase
LRHQLASGGAGINPTSKLMLTILAGVATWEREIMLERQREGIAKAKAAGKYKDRPVCRLPRGRGVIEQFAAAAGNFSIGRAWYRLPGPDAKYPEHRDAVTHQSGVRHRKDAVLD